VTAIPGSPIWWDLAHWGLAGRGVVRVTIRPVPPREVAAGDPEPWPGNRDPRGVVG